MVTQVDRGKNQWRNKGRLRFPVNGLVLYAPLWNSQLSGSPFNVWNIADGGVYSCTVTGATWGIQGRTFDGSDDGILTDSLLVSNSANLTIEMWVKWNTGTDTQYLYTEDTNDGASFFVRKDATNQKLSFGILVTSTWYLAQSAGAILVSGTWQHIVARLSSTSGMSVLADLVSVATDANTLPGNFANVNSAIGAAWLLATGLGESFNGTIGEVRLYNRALTVAEIGQNYRATKGRYL